MTDYEGSVVQTLNNAGASIATTTYSALGVSSGSTPSPYGFQGMQWDSTLGMYYDNARLYDPALGRFISEDPLGFAGTDNGNLYDFVGNDPTGYSDPSGLDPTEMQQPAGGGNGNGGGAAGGGAATAQGPGGSTITGAALVPFPPVAPGQTVFSPGQGGLWRVRKTPNQPVPPGGALPQRDPNYDARYPGGSILNVPTVIAYPKAAQQTLLQSLLNKLSGFIDEAKMVGGYVVNNPLAATGNFLKGASEGAVVVANELTLHSIDVLNTTAQQLLAQYPYLQNSQLAGIIARECLQAAATGGGVSLVKNRVGRVVGIVVQRVAPNGIPCAAKTIGNILQTGVVLYLAKDQIAATAKAVEDAYEALLDLNGESPEAVVEKLTKAGISLAELGYTGKDLLGMARRMTKDGFRKFFSGCFAAGTKIRTDRGWVAIEDVQAGDQVWSRSEAGPDHPGSYQTVELTMRRSSPIVALRVGGQVIRTTLEHPFWVRHKGWTATRDLRFGDELAGKDDEWTTVDAIDSTNEYANVYNIGVSNEHTYFVGDDGWAFSVWAHNTDGECQVPANGSEEQKQALNAPNKPPLRYKLGKNDLDWRGTGKTHREALDEAFKRTGHSMEEFEVTKWAKDVNGKSHPAEWRHKDGSEVNIDWPHAKNGPDAPHVGWQTGGKRSSGGAERGHIILDEVPYNRSQIKE